MDTQTRHALKHDRLVDATRTSVNWFDENRSKVIQAAVAAVVLLGIVIAGLVVIRIMLQFLLQSIGVIVLRIRRPDLPRPFRMWLYPLPALTASVGFLFVLFSRTNSLTQIRYAVLILISGAAIYLVRAWRHGEWPFADHAAGKRSSN